MRIIGLMSGTSHDGVDAALVEIEGLYKKKQSRNLKTGLYIPLDNTAHGPINVGFIHHLHRCYHRSLRDDIERAFTGDTERICELNFRLGKVFSEVVLDLLKRHGLKASDIDAVSSHGQTVCHIPPKGRRRGATLQIGEPAVIAELTEILTVSDFRVRDMAAGGQGAPLVPLSDYLMFRNKGLTRAVLNIGGIANVTIVRDRPEDTIAFDTGPGNALMDEAVKIFTGGKLPFDRNGAIARKGKVNGKLLKELLSHPYFRKGPPKSTGREEFGREMVSGILRKHRSLSFEDTVATLTHLTVISIHMSLGRYSPDELIVTGGGTKNSFMTGLLRDMFREGGTDVNDISRYGIPPLAKEAVSFAVLGYLTLKGRAGNIPAATGAGHPVILGKLTLP